ncbi:MAG TPA: restriction endonuclease, partial [Bacteroidia bacterium]|nr:restriction endonuclease [Bacteroidia bacterium]
MSFQTILDHYRQHAFSERDKGARFERLMQAYLQTDRRYADQFRHVWLWNEFFGRQDLGGGDTGIDLVAETITGEYWAIQCKCYREDAIIDKPAVDGFLATSGKTFRDKAGKVTRFAHRLWISTTNHWGPNATEAIKNQHPEVTRL